MNRTLARDVKSHVGKTVLVEGWLHKKRLLRPTFINIRDRSGLVQVVVQDKTEVEKLRGLQIGTVYKFKVKLLTSHAPRWCRAP